MKNVFGVLVILGACFCAFMAFMMAGGQHGMNSFRPERLARGDAMLASGGTVALLMLGLTLLFAGNKKT